MTLASRFQFNYPPIEISLPQSRPLGAHVARYLDKEGDLEASVGAVVAAKDHLHFALEEDLGTDCAEGVGALS